MSSDLQIVVDPGVPRLGHPVRMSLESGGEPIAENTSVKWTMRRRDDPREHWPHAGQEGPTIQVASWGPSDHATYYAEIEGGHRAARTVPDSIRVALSGGGFRASLFGLGALLYLVDTGAAYRIEDIASVSGGSITNAFVCQRCDLTLVTGEGFWTLCADFARLATRRFLPGRRIPMTVWFIVLFSAWATALSIIGVWIGWPWALGYVGVSVALSPFRGFLFFEPTLRFHFGLKSSLDQHSRRVSHVFCSTDVVVGEPFYFLATRFGGFFWSRRRGACPTQYPVAKAVRASAAYPFAFLPKHVPLKTEFEWGEEPGRKELLYKSRHAYCTDGGVSNNLGTQWFDENDPNDWPYRLLAEFNKGFWQPGSEFVELAVDASGPLRTMDRHLLWLPVLGEFRGLYRAMGLLYENTLAPRRANAAWELSEIHNAGYAQFVGEGRFLAAIHRRGAHRRTLVPLDPQLPFEALYSKEGRYLLELPDSMLGIGALTELEAAGMPPEKVEELLVRVRQIPTTLFRLSREEAVSAVLGGYIATLINAQRYEGLGSPDSLLQSLERIRALL